MKKVRDKALLDDKDEISYYHRHKFDKEYNSIIKTVYEANPLPKTPTKNRVARKKQSIKFDLQTG